MNEDKLFTWDDFKSQDFGGGLWLTLLCRVVAQRFAYLFYKLGLSPNMVTLLGVVVTLLGLGVIISVDNLNLFFNGLLVVVLLLGYVFDCADGQLARVTKKGSKFGEWLDHTLDSFTGSLVHLAAGYLMLREVGAEDQMFLWAYLGLVFNMVGSSTYFFGWNMKGQLAGSNAVASSMKQGSLKLKLMKLPLQLTDKTLLLLVFLFAYDVVLFTWCYLGYGLLTFGIYALYLIVSGHSLSKLS